MLPWVLGYGLPLKHGRGRPRRKYAAVRLRDARHSAPRVRLNIDARLYFFRTGTRTYR